MINSGMPGKPKHLGVPNGRMVSVGSEPEPQEGVGTPRVESRRHTRQGCGGAQGGCQPAGEGGNRQLLAVVPGAVTPGPFQIPS